MAQVQLMDGSMGHYLLSRGVPKDEKLWSARAIVEEKYHPIVVQGHVDYIRAGAKMITTNSYAIQPSYYSSAFPEDWEARMPKDVETSVKLAEQARQICGVSKDTVRILGSLPPLVQTFRPDLTDKYIKETGEQACVRTYRTLAQALIKAGADALIGETLNGWQEAKLVVEATKDLGVPLLLCVEGTCRGADLQPAPKNVLEVARQVLKAKKEGAPIEAFGLNCAQPEYILEALECLKSSGAGPELKAAGVKLAAYANVNDTAHIHKGGFDLKKAASLKIETRKDCLKDGYAQWCKKMFNAGLDYCGGCCGTEPAHIAQLEDTIKEMGAKAPAMPPPPTPLGFEARRARKPRSAL